jgi:hypothetical protein
VAAYCEDVADWKDSADYSCTDYQYMAEVDGENNCGYEDSAVSCCFCGGGATCKPCGPTQFFQSCGDCRECSAAAACPEGQVRAGCGYGSVGNCLAPKVDKSGDTASSSSARGLGTPASGCLLARALSMAVVLLGVFAG